MTFRTSVSGGAPSATSKPFGLGARGCEIAEIDGRRAPAEIAPGDPVEPEVHALDEGVLRCHDPSLQLRGIVIDPLREPAAFELGKQPELAELRELHRSPLSLRRRRGPRV